MSVLPCHTWQIPGSVKTSVKTELLSETLCLLRTKRTRLIAILFDDYSMNHMYWRSPVRALAIPSVNVIALRLLVRKELI